MSAANTVVENGGRVVLLDDLGGARPVMAGNGWELDMFWGFFMIS